MYAKYNDNYGKGGENVKVLIKIRNSPERLFLVEVMQKSLIEEIKKMIWCRKYSKAMATTLARGRFHGELSRQDICMLDVDLILTKENARWDLMG